MNDVSLFDELAERVARLRLDPLDPVARLERDDCAEMLRRIARAHRQQRPGR